MKKIFKKNQLIITGLALMIAAAGYLSYRNTGLKNDTKESASINEVKDEYEISDEDSKSEEIFTDTEASEEVADASQATSETSAEGMSEEEAEAANPGEAVLTDGKMLSSFFQLQLLLLQLEELFRLLLHSLPDSPFLRSCSRFSFLLLQALILSYTLLNLLHVQS